MYCESCGATIPDDASTCPNCGVSMALFLQKKAVHTVTQTVPDFVKVPGSQPEANAAPAAVQATANTQPVGADSNTSAVAPAKTPTNKPTKAGYVLGIISALLIVFPYTYALIKTVWIFLIFIIPLSGLILSIIGLIMENGRQPAKAITGIVLSIASPIIILLLYYFIILPVMEELLRSVLSHFSVTYNTVDLLYWPRILI